MCGGLRYIDAGFRGACRRDSPRAADIQGPAFGQTDNDTGGPRGGLPHRIGRRGLPVSTDGDGQRRFGQFEDVPQVVGGSGDRGRGGDLARPQHGQEHDEPGRFVGQKQHHHPPAWAGDAFESFRRPRPRRSTVRPATA